MTHRILCAHALAATLLASLAAPMAHAANECRIVYGYHTPSMPGPVRHEVDVDLNAGQLATLDVARLDFVRSKNSSAHRVRVKLEGAIQNEFTLNNGDRNPISAAGYYLTPTTLKELRCTTEVVPAALGSPAQLISTLNAVNQTSAQIALALQTHFNLGAAEIANLLINAGFPINEVTQTLRNALGVTAAEAINILHATGSSMQQVATTVRTAFNASTADMVSGFLQFWASVDNLQCTATSCPPMLASRLAELRTALSTQPQEFANAVASGLRTHFHVDAQRCAALLDAIGQISREMAQIAMIAAGYLADQVSAALNFVYGTGTFIVAQTATIAIGAASSAVEAGQSASADSLNLVYVVHGEYRQCTMPARDIFGLDTVIPKPLPLPPNNQITTITLGFSGPKIGRASVNVAAPAIATVSALTGFPAGVNAMIREKGSCFIIVDVMVPGSTPSGANGKANVMVGGQSGPAFDWTIGNTPSPVPGRGYDYAAFPEASARQFSLVPVLESLYQVGSATTMDADGAMFTALLPPRNNPWCQTIGPAPAPRQPAGARSPRGGMESSATSQVTIPDVVWGVQNMSSAAMTNVTVELRNGGQSLATQSIASLAPNQRVTFTYQRAMSTACVARIGNDNFCYHCGPATQGWNDNMLSVHFP